MAGANNSLVLHVLTTLPSRVLVPASAALRIQRAARAFLQRKHAVAAKHQADAVCSEDPGLVAALPCIFGGFPNAPPPDDQTDSCVYLSRFATFLRAEGVHAGAADELAALAAGHHESIRCYFYPRYGCVLLAITTLGCAAEATSRLRLLCPDVWSFCIRSGAVSAHPGADTTVAVGNVPASELDDLMARSASLLAKAEQENKGDKRSAAVGRQGHQQTPALIHAVLLDALAGKTEGVNVPSGGFTDVGLHTGNQPRSTSWQLAEAVVRFVLNKPSDAANEPCVRMTLARWQLWLTEVVLASRAKVPPECVAHMLDSAAGRGAELADEGHDVGAFERRAAAARRALLAQMTTEACVLAAKYVMPPLAQADGCIDGQECCLPVLKPPPMLEAQRGRCDLAAARERAFTNLGWLPLPPSDADATAVLSWMQHARFKATGLPAGMMPHLLAAGFETWMFSHAVTVLPSADALAGLSTKQLEALIIALQAAVDLYREGLHACGARLLVELRSRETLVAWAACCVADKVARRLHPS